MLKLLSQRKRLVYTSSGTRFPGIPICRQVFPHSERPFLPHLFIFFYISYVTLPSVERREEWYVRRFELRKFFFSDCPSTGLPPLGPLAGTFFTFFLSFRASHRFLPRFSPAVAATTHIRRLGLWCASVVAIPRLFFFSGVFPVPGKSRRPSRSSLAFFLVVCLFLFFFLFFSSSLVLRLRLIFFFFFLSLFFI